MSNEENSVEKKEITSITINDKEYKFADLNEEQMALVSKMNIAANKLNGLQPYYDDYVITNDYKDLCIKSFERSVESEVVEEE